MEPNPQEIRVEQITSRSNLNRQRFIEPLLEILFIVNTLASAMSFGNLESLNNGIPSPFYPPTLILSTEQRDNERNANTILCAISTGVMLITFAHGINRRFPLIRR